MLGGIREWILDLVSNCGCIYSTIDGINFSLISAILGPKPRDHTLKVSPGAVTLWDLITDPDPLK